MGEAFYTVEIQCLRGNHDIVLLFNILISFTHTPFSGYLILRALANNVSCCTEQGIGEKTTAWFYHGKGKKPSIFLCIVIVYLYRA